MNYLNLVLVEGNLVRDAEFRLTNGGKPVSSFTIGVNRRYKTGSEYRHEASFIEVEAWGWLAELSKRMGNKGRLARIAGRLRQDRWQDAEGRNHNKIVVVAEELDFKTECKCRKEDASADQAAATEAEADAGVG
jgi:single-strand DNA-binding protein